MTVRYIATCVFGEREHSYNSKINRALEYAQECASHKSMQGQVFAEDQNGDRTLVYTSNGYKKQTKKRKEQDNG